LKIIHADLKILRWPKATFVIVVAISFVNPAGTNLKKLTIGTIHAQSLFVVKVANKENV